MDLSARHHFRGPMYLAAKLKPHADAATAGITPRIMPASEFALGWSAGGHQRGIPTATR